MASIRALDVIQDAFERLNRLSPGEPLGADEAAFGFRRLNSLVDELAARQLFLFKDVLTSAAQTGQITLGVGSWITLAPGTEIISATQNNIPLAPITMQQFNELYVPTQTGAPGFWAQDGLSNVFLWPVPTGQTIKLQTRTGVAAFADQTTSYTVPDGWAAALGAGLAVRMAPVVLGNLPPSLLTAEKRCMDGIDHYEPAIVSYDGYSNSRQVYPPRLF